MKTYLLPRDGQFYKANMHSHSTLSDGQVTPSELKLIYKKKGYSVFAFTEHSTYHDLREKLDDKDFITLPSYEAHLDRDYDRTPYPALLEGGAPASTEAEAVHFNMFAIDPDKPMCEVKVDDIFDFSIEHANELIRRGKEAGFLVCYNHPHWSLNTAAFYNALEGVDAIEIANGSSYRSSSMDYVPHVYREMAWKGKRMICIGGDDNHHVHHFFHAWTMIKAPELSHKAIMDALIAGNCYSSCGPEIHELYVEDGELHIKTSEAQGIFFSTAGRRKQVVLSEENDGNPVTEGVFPIYDTDVFFHVTVTDMHGKPANTRIFYLDEADFQPKHKPQK
jgi:hypothetical protein